VSTEAPAPARSSRTLALACLGSACAAALLWGASALTWYTVSPTGRAPLVFTGAQVSPSIGGFAWVALAAVAGLVATGGPARRVLAVLIGFAGAAAAFIGLVGWTRTEYAADSAGPVPPGATLPPPPLVVTPAPLLAVAGGLLLLAVGVLVVIREPRLPRLGARYAAPGTRPVEIDPDRAAWQDLDAGRDPTADPARDEGDDPDVGAGRGAG
jgi:Tryptophan-associated transmembrane protein (Trp_oprn_chp)